MLNWSLGLPTFIITLREGVEAALVVGIVLSLLNQTQRTDLRKWVWGAVVLGLIMSMAIGIFFQGLMLWINQSHSEFSQILEPCLKVGFTLTAIALLSWMLLWMTEQAKSMKASLEGELHTLLSQSPQAQWAVFSLVLIAVLREGFETAIFLAAQETLSTPGLLGAMAGLVGAILIGWLLFALGVKLNLKTFFQVMGIFLILIVAGLILSLCKSLDTVAIALNTLPQWQSDLCPFNPSPNTSCLWGPRVWNGKSILPDNQFPGLLFKALLGYRDQIFLIQASAYGLFLTTLLTCYLKRLNITVQGSSQALSSSTVSSKSG